jgi:hypothetical protein
MYNGSSSPTVSNCTFSGNSAQYGGGMACYLGSESTVSNCIIWGNTASSDGYEIAIEDSTVNVSYCDVRGGLWDIYIGGHGLLNWGPRNIQADPFFAGPSNDDYHLRSEGGRWDPSSETWVLDDVTSPCLDKGKPSGCSVGDEPYPNGGRINMGAYGTTGQASKSPTITCWEGLECAGQCLGDATCDGKVNLADLLALKANFGTSAPWADDQCCADFSHDGNVNLDDLLALKAGFATSGYSPSTLNQSCPP